MSDVLVTIPKSRWADWLAEGSLPGETSDTEYHYFGSGPLPRISPGERVYVVAHGVLRGYAPLVRLETRRQALERWIAQHARMTSAPAFWWWDGAAWGLVRSGGAVAVTIAQPIPGFRGWRYRFWDRADERPFPDWQRVDIPQRAG